MTRERALAAGLLVVLTAIQFSGLAHVPFHPDESSLVVQSRDLEQLLSEPLSMAWSEARSADPAQAYRALNAPLAKYVLGIGRALAGQDASRVAVDWDWSRSWDQNREAGALPPREVLLPARAASTLMVVGSLVLIVLVGHQMGGLYTGWLAAALLGLNALVLLHGRRAMSEGTLTFAMTLALWGMLQGDSKPWLAGAAAALAFGAKHTAVAMLPVGLLAALWRPGGSGQPAHGTQAERRSAMIREPAARAAVFLVTAAAVVMALNPLLWVDPLHSAGQVLRARRELVAEQVRAQSAHSALGLPLTGADRTAALIGQLYLTPVQFEEIPNYARELAPSIQAYVDQPLHGLLRGWLAGMALLGLTLAGILLGLTQLRRAAGPERRTLGLLLLATLAQGGLLLFSVPFPYQRYYLPLVPLCTLWASYAVVRFAGAMKRLPVRRAA